VVIPKEIRRTMRIREGDPLEIYTDREGEVIFKKYSPIGELTGFAAQYAETLYKTCGFPVVICDRDAVIACAGLPRKEFMEKRLSAEMEAIMESRTLYVADGSRQIDVTDDAGEGYCVSCAMPILTEGDITGCVAAVSPRSGESSGISPDAEQKLVQTAAIFLGKQLEQ